MSTNIYFKTPKFLNRPLYIHCGIIIPACIPCAINYKGSFKNYVDKMRWVGCQKRSTFRKKNVHIVGDQKWAKYT